MSGLVTMRMHETETNTEKIHRKLMSPRAELVPNIPQCNPGKQEIRENKSVGFNFFSITKLFFSCSQNTFIDRDMSDT